MTDHEHRSLKGWDGTLHRIEAGLYALQSCSCGGVDHATVTKDDEDKLWRWDVSVAGGEAVSDGLDYPYRLDAVDAAVAYVHSGELAVQP